MPDELRPIINRAYVIMLQRNGMVSAIVDAFDQELADVVNGKKPEAVKIVHDIMDGKSVDIPSMSKEHAELRQDRPGHHGPGPVLRFLAGNLSPVLFASQQTRRGGFLTRPFFVLGDGSGRAAYNRPAGPWILQAQCLHSTVSLEGQHHLLDRPLQQVQVEVDVIAVQGLQKRRGLDPALLGAAFPLRCT